MMDVVIVPSRLISAGFTVSRATELYGQLSGMASVLINLPTIFTIAIATSLVPAIAEARAIDDKGALFEKINNGMRVAMMMALPSAAGLFALAYPITDWLFACPEAGIPLVYLAIAVIVLALFQVTSASLQGLGHPEIPLRNLVVIGLLKVVFNYSLTGIADLNIRGPAIGTTIAFLAGSTLNMIELTRRTGVKYEWNRLVKLAVIAAAMGVAAKVCYEAMGIWGLTSHWATLGAILVGVGVYGTALVLSGEMDMKLIMKYMSIGRGAK